MHEVERKLNLAWPPQQRSGLRMLLAVSGGSDSMAMLRAMAALCQPQRRLLRVAHFHHGLRGEDADRDQVIVEETCRQLDIECLTGRAGVDTPPLDFKDGLEASARAARYRFLQLAAERTAARYVATAHTAEDQAETILHRIIRGTGIGGLAGMPRARKLGEAVTLIRPLLGVRRGELRAYLADIGQAYREDDSNADTDPTRNRIRHELLPMLADRFNPSVGEALLRLGSLAGEVQAVIDPLVERFFEEAVAVDADGRTVRIDAVCLASQPAYLIRELLKAVWRRAGWPMQSMGHEQWSDLAELLAMAADTPPRSTAKESCTLPGSVSATTAAGLLMLRR